MMFEEGSTPREMFGCINSSMVSSKMKNMMNKRRFRDEQVRSLESIFKNETKLEPKKKVQLAQELGLQPRQVAIWFQNKRARYKSKQLERDYTIWSANYNALASQFESLKKEKQALLLQVEKLRDLVGKADDVADGAAANKNNEVGSDHPENGKSEESGINATKNDQTSDHEAKPDSSMEAAGSEYGASIVSDEGSCENTNYFGADEMDILKMVEPVVGVGGSLTPDEANWDYLGPDGLFDHAVDSCQWSDFWT